MRIPLTQAHYEDGSIALLWKEKEEDDIFKTVIAAEDWHRIPTEDLVGTLVPVDYYMPEYESGWTLYEKPLEDHLFLKKAPLYDYEPEEEEKYWPKTEVRDWLVGSEY